MQGLVRSMPGSGAAGSGAVRTAAVAALVVLVPLRAWTEEAPRTEVGWSASASDAAPGTPAEPALTGLPPEVPASPPADPELENPWRPLVDHASTENLERACTPWSTSIGCTGELELLFDPWLAAPAPTPQGDAAEGSDSTLAPARVPTAPPSSPAGLETGMPPAIEAAPGAPGAPGNSDSWVVDPGLPEAPFD